MSDGAPQPGWYKGPDGERQWWNGQAWGPVDEVTSEPNEVVDVVETGAHGEPRPPMSRRLNNALVYGGIAVAVFLIGGALLGIFGGNPFGPLETVDVDSHLRNAELRAEELAEERAETVELRVEQVLDDSMVEAGYSVIESGNHYWRWFTEEEKAASTCGYRACTWLTVFSNDGCSAGFYVKADVMSGGVPIGWTNEMSASVTPYGYAVVTLESPRGNGDSFRISEIRCMG